MLKIKFLRFIRAGLLICFMSIILYFSYTILYGYIVFYGTPFISKTVFVNSTIIALVLPGILTSILVGCVLLVPYGFYSKERTLFLYNFIAIVFIVFTWGIKNPLIFENYVYLLDPLIFYLIGIGLCYIGIKFRGH
jgi:hypothetical protein